MCLCDRGEYLNPSYFRESEVSSVRGKIKSNQKIRNGLNAASIFRSFQKEAPNITKWNSPLELLSARASLIRWFSRQAHARAGIVMIFTGRLIH